MRKLSRITLVIYVFFIVTLTNVSALPSYTSRVYVNDFANVLSDDTEDYIYSNSKVLNEKTSAQLVVATVESLEGKTVEEYSLNLFREWGIGNKDKNNGLLILLAPNERKLRIEVGYGLEGAINDSKAGRLRDAYAIPNFKNNDWDKGIKDLYMALLTEVYIEYGLDVPEDIPQEYLKYHEGNDIDGGIVIFGVIVLCIVMSFIIYKKNDNNNNHNGGSGTPFNGDYGTFTTYPGDTVSFGGSFGGDSFGGGSCGGGGASGSF